MCVRLCVCVHLFLGLGLWYLTKLSFNSFPPHARCVIPGKVSHLSTSRVPEMTIVPTSWSFCEVRKIIYVKPLAQCLEHSMLSITFITVFIFLECYLIAIIISL